MPRMPLHGQRPHWLEMDQLCADAGSVALVRDANATLVAGQVSALVGPNGAGKSSLLGLLSGQTKPSQGRVRLNGRLLQDFSATELARCRAVMAQANPVAFDFRVREVVELGRFPHQLKPSTDEAGIVTQALRCCDLLALADRRIHSLSGGEAARVSLARALAQIWEPQPELGARWLMLDEPTAALDLAHQLEVMAIAQDWACESMSKAPESPVGVLVVLHDLNLALRFAQQVLVMQSGRIKAQGPTAQTLTAELVSKVWGVNAELLAHRAGHGHLVLS